jgi:hypothetical protein
MDFFPKKTGLGRTHRNHRYPVHGQVQSCTRPRLKSSQTIAWKNVVDHCSDRNWIEGIPSLFTLLRLCHECGKAGYTNLRSPGLIHQYPKSSYTIRTIDQTIKTLSGDRVSNVFQCRRACNSRWIESWIVNRWHVTLDFHRAASSRLAYVNICQHTSTYVSFLSPWERRLRVSAYLRTHETHPLKESMTNALKGRSTLKRAMCLA